MDVYVINLDHQHEKWNIIKNKLIAHNLNPIKIRAVNSYYINDKSDKTTLFKMFGNQRLEAIYASHIKVWKTILKNNKNNKNKYSLILEDDAIPINKLNKHLNKLIKNIPEKWDIILLGCIGCCNEDNKCNNILD